MSNKITISGNIAHEPEFVAGDYARLSFPLYDNERRKVKGTENDYEDTGNVTKLRVTLWGDLAQEWSGKIHKGDVVEIEGSITEREYEKQDGTTGRSLQTTFVNSLVVKFQKNAAASSAPAAPAEDPWASPVPAGWAS